MKAPKSKKTKPAGSTAQNARAVADPLNNEEPLPNIERAFASAARPNPDFIALLAAVLDSELARKKPRKAADAAGRLWLHSSELCDSIVENLKSPEPWGAYLAVGDSEEFNQRRSSIQTVSRHPDEKLLWVGTDDERSDLLKWIHDNAGKTKKLSNMTFDEMMGLLKRFRVAKGASEGRASWEFRVLPKAVTISDARKLLSWRKDSETIKRSDRRKKAREAKS
jgi:hypothetical protein